MRAPFVTVLVPFSPGKSASEVAGSVEVSLDGEQGAVVTVDGVVEVTVGRAPERGEGAAWAVRRQRSSGADFLPGVPDVPVGLASAAQAYRASLVRALGEDGALCVPLHAFTGSSSRHPAMRFLAAGNLACAGWATERGEYLDLASKVLEETLVDPEWGFEDGTWAGNRSTSAKGHLKKPHAYALRCAWLLEKSGRGVDGRFRAILRRMAMERQALDFAEGNVVPSDGQVRRSLLGYNKAMSDMIGAFWACALFPDECCVDGPLARTMDVRERCWALWTGGDDPARNGRWEPDDCLHYGALAVGYLLDAAMLLGDRGRDGLRGCAWLRSVFERLRDCEVLSSGDGVGHGAAGTGSTGSHPWGGLLTVLGVLLDDPTFVYVGAKAARAACAQDAVCAEHAGRRGWEAVDGLPRPSHAAYLAAFVPLMLGIDAHDWLEALETRAPETRSCVYHGMTKFGPRNGAVPCKIVLRTGHRPGDASLVVDLGGKMKSNEDQLAGIKAFCARGVCLTNAVRDKGAVPGQERVRLAQDTQSVMLVPNGLAFPQTGTQRLAETGTTERPDPERFPLHASCYACVGEWGVGAEFGFDEADGDVVAVDRGMDAFGMLRLSKYFRPDTRLTRQIILTAEGVLVVRDDLSAGESVAGFQGGPLWHLLHMRDRAAHLADDSTGSNWFAQDVVNGEFGRSRLLIYHAARSGRTVGIADGATHAREVL